MQHEERTVVAQFLPPSRRGIRALLPAFSCKSIVISAFCAVAVFAQPATSPIFDVVSIKLNNECAAAGRGWGKMGSPGTLEFECIKVQDLIQIAYGGVFSEPGLKVG